MSMVCCLSHRPQQSWQICSTIRAPIAPGKGGRSNAGFTSPQRTQVISGLSGVVDFREAEDLKHADVDPTDVELEPPRGEVGGLRIGVVVVVELLAAQPDGDRRDVPALVLHV